MNFISKLSAAWTRNDSLLCVGLDPDLARLPAHLQVGTGRHCPLLHRHHRRHRRPGLRLQAADRLLRRARRRGPARADLPLPARTLSAHPADPRRQARRHRRHRPPVRARSLRALWRGRGHRQSLHGLRLGRALPGLARPRRDRAVPHLERGRLGPAVPRCRRPAAVPARGAPGGRQMEPQRPVRAGGGGDLSGGTGAGQGDRRRHAAAGAGHRGAGGRRRSDRARRAHGRWRRDDDQFVAGDFVCGAG